jgi:MSHA biogenesis protein MshP
MTMRGGQRGFSLMSAIFLVVVVAMIAGFAVSIGNAQRSGSVLGLVATRAAFAAQSGLDWAVAVVTDTHACVPGGATLSPEGPGLDGFVVTVDCVAVAVTEGSVPYTIFTLDVVASSGAEGSEDFVRRRVSAQVADGAP